MAHLPRPWLIPGRHTERNAPHGTRCDSTCLRPTPSQAHCSVCGSTFSGVSGFDMHRRDGWCLNPATLSKPLTQDDRGIWRWPKSVAMDNFVEQLRGPMPLPGL